MRRDETALALPAYHKTSSSRSASSDGSTTVTDETSFWLVSSFFVNVEDTPPVFVVASVAEASIDTETFADVSSVALSAFASRCLSMETKNKPGNCLKPASSAVFLMNCERRSTRTAMRNSLPASSPSAPMISKSRCAFRIAARVAAAFSSTRRSIFSSAGFGRGSDSARDPRSTVETGERRDKPLMSGMATETSFARAGDPDPEEPPEASVETSFSTVNATCAVDAEFADAVAPSFESSVLAGEPRDRNEYPRRSFPRSFMPTMDIKLDLLPCGVLGMWPGVPPPPGVPLPRGAEPELSSLLSVSSNSNASAGASFSNGESSLHCSTSTSPSRSFTCPSFCPGARPPRCMATIAAP